MTLRWHRDGSGSDATPRAVMDTCPACGAVREWHYYQFATHLLHEHDPEDFGLPPLGEVEPITAGEERRPLARGGSA